MDVEVKTYLNNFVPVLQRSDSSLTNGTGLYNLTDSQGDDLAKAPKKQAFTNLQVTPEIREALGYCNNWNFNIFHLFKITDGHPLIHLMHYLFDKYGFFEYYKIDLDIFYRFIDKVERNYNPNNYHNVIHAADVAQTVHSLIQIHGLQDMLTIDDVFVLLFAASIHDLDHPGVNNAFLIASGAPLAITYNDFAVSIWFFLQLAHIS